MNFDRTIPLSLYIHIPWCIKKCPYCDFNSHAVQSGQTELPEKAYIDQLMTDLSTQLTYVQNRPIHSIFIGGGTPSLFSAKAYGQLFSLLQKELVFSEQMEITLEANPGTIETDRFKSYFDVGINRVSLGVQSFQNEKLAALGRIHQNAQAIYAAKEIQQAGFRRFNIDLMFGLPNQTIKDALFDLEQAIDLSPSHVSWYQLTLEPNTFFHRFPPVLPSDDVRFDIQQAGQQFLRKHDFKQYEISAYSKNDPCRHNLNYWLFGDYLGIGAGAHAKLTELETKKITRRMSIKHPKAYLSATPNQLAQEIVLVEKKELPLEFMMNALRLFQPIEIQLFETRTGLSFSVVENNIACAVEEGLMQLTPDSFYVTEQGQWFLNDVLALINRT